ncbi:glutathione S-transferase family protein [Myxococcus sp. AM009]|uniref:glutathione S-transferase family protein n=1 Tax=Myxococcus sp. AM009 TaxID=2745137 RepID=UPI0015962339|nr:glutathione S-transferase family protein [Myxococcus sp. AM009]NVJ01324.1 glutathione S-transferase family protein [Myxococcus sp. AM009]
MKLYFHPMSGNSRRVLLVATHLGTPLERIEVDLTTGKQREAPYLGINPNGRVPALDDDGFVLWESRAIMLYLAEKTPGQPLLPTDARGRADVNRWLFWCSAHMSPAATVLVLENFVKQRTGRGPPNPTEVARGEALFAQAAPVLDSHLAGRTWVTQDRLTLADFSLASSFALAGPARLPLGDYANIRAWLGRVQELEAWQRTAPPAPSRA